MNQIVDYQPSFIADAVYYIVLYSALMCTVLPVIYVLLWKFLGFWSKHRILFYLFALALAGGGFAAFYLTCNDWLLYYYAFPSYVQITGLVLFALSFIAIRVSHHHLDLKTITFYSVLSQKQAKLTTGGVYRIVRHPVYSMIPLIILGAFLYTGEFILVIPFAANVLLRWYYAGLEEKYLHATYGDAYSAYRKSTPNRFYPAWGRARG